MRTIRPALAAALLLAAGALFKYFGFTPENVAETVLAVLERG